MEEIKQYKKNNNIKEINIKYFDYIFDKNLNVIGNIELSKKFLLNNDNIKKGGKLLNEIEDNYKIFKQNIISNNYYLGKLNYKYYINDIINNYNYLLNEFNNFNILNEELEFDNDNYKKIIYYIYLTFYNYKLTDDDIFNFENDKNYNIMYDRLYNITYAIEDIKDNIKDNIYFNNVFNILITIYNYFDTNESLINYELINLCYKIFNENNYKLKTNFINNLINKLKTFNTQNKNEIKFVLNNFYEKYDDKFYNDDFKLNYISQFNIYALYFIYQFNYNDELNNQIKLFLNL